MSMQSADPPDPNEIFQPILGYLGIIVEIFSSSCYFVFQWGMVILCAFFVLLGLNLLRSSKEKETNEKMVATNLEYVKKHGRLPTVILILIGIGFLFKLLVVFIVVLFDFESAPVLSILLKVDKHFEEGFSLESVIKLSLTEAGLIFLISIVSFLSFIFFSYGLYLFCFNQKILKTRKRPFGFTITGFVGLILTGISTPFYLIL